MSETPSKRRRKGRDAFTPGADPMEFQPYEKNSWAYNMDLKDWLDGWHEAEVVFDAEEKLKEEEEDEDRCPTCGHVYDECPTCGERITT